MLPSIYVAVILYLTAISEVDNKVCQSIRVHNSPDDILKFKDCRVIEGYLHLVLMENHFEEDFIYNSFSELYEIRDYLMIYRVFGITSLKNVFPKLASIKGENLFNGSALILYELDDIKEIGLINLTNIEEGSVRIGRCPNLCYVDTLNWTAVGVADVIYDDDRPATCELERCPNDCRGYCWNNYECQIFTKNQCHYSCIGCSQFNSPQHCNLCKFLNNSGTCVRTCPEDKLTDNHNASCIYAKECLSRPNTWSIFNNTCDSECPTQYKRNSNGMCIFSGVQICKGKLIRNFLDYEFLRGCTHIDGSLEIATENAHIDISDLEINLKNIVSISGYLKVVRSTHMTTLSFLKSLKIIKGEELWGSVYSLFVTDNPNLQNLFSENSTLVLQQGGAIFNNNPYLCPSGLKNINATTSEVFSFNNGFEMFCNPKKYIRTAITETNPKDVKISWQGFLEKPSVGYVVYYREMTVNEVYFLKIRNELVLLQSTWNSIWTYNNSVNLKNLTPFTSYIYYVRSNFLTEEQNLQSAVNYFQTATDFPPEPEFLEAQYYTDTNITLTWIRPSLDMNGILSHYKIGYAQESLSHLPQRNYCLHPYKKDICFCGGQNIDIWMTHSFERKFEYLKNVGHKIIPKFHNLKHVKYFMQPNDWMVTFVVSGLKPFTMYTFFVQVCNKDDKGENVLCGDFKMLSQRTKKSKNADLVAEVFVEVSEEAVIVSWEKPKNPNSAIVAYNVEYRSVVSNVSKLECRTNEEFENEGSKFKIFGLKLDHYKIRVRAVSLAGPGDFSQWKDFHIK